MSLFGKKSGREARSQDSDGVEEFELDGEQELDEGRVQELPILPLRGVVVYPMMWLPLTVGQARSVRLIDEALENRILDARRTFASGLPSELHSTIEFFAPHAGYAATGSEGEQVREFGNFLVSSKGILDPDRCRISFQTTLIIASNDTDPFLNHVLSDNLWKSHHPVWKLQLLGPCPRIGAKNGNCGIIRMFRPIWCSRSR